MRLQDYSLSNWGPHIHKRIQFDPSAKTIAILGENDLGKSWIQRGIGFLFSLGRNEYGDFTSIFNNGPQANLSLQFEHEGKTHTIEKTVLQKDEKSENSSFLINGNAENILTGETFFRDTLRLPHPRIWLPLCIAMQGEVDHYLRAKKAPREESFRELRQLQKIDQWHEQLKKILSDLQNTLSEDTGKAKQKASEVEKRKEELELDFKTKTLQLQELSQGEDWTLSDKYEKALQLQTLQTERSRLRLELSHESQNLQTFESEKARDEANLQAQTHSPDALSSAELALEKLENQILAKKCEQNQEKLKRLNTKLQTLLEKLDKTKAQQLSPTKKQELEELQASILRSQTQVQIVQKNAPTDTLSSLEATLEELRRNLQTQKKEEAEAEDLRHAWKNAIKKAEQILQAPILPTKNSAETAAENLRNQKTQLILQEESEIGDILPEEAKTLQRRLLSHWEHHAGQTCPCCEQPFPPAWSDPTNRSKLLQELRKTELASTQKTKSRLKEILQIDTALEELEAATIFVLPNYTEAPKTPLSQTISERIALLETQIQNLKDLQKAKDQLEENLLILRLENLTIPQLQEKLNFSASAESQITALQTEISETKTEIAALNEEIQTSETTEPAPELELSELQKQKLQKSEEIKTLRKNAADYQKTLANLQKTKGKIEEISKKLKEKQTLLDNTIKTIGEILGKIDPSEEEEEGFIKKWQAQEKEAAQLRTLLANIPTQLEKLQTEAAEAKATWEKIEQETNILLAAKEAQAFIDYKKAPRELLKETIDEIFERTNEIAATFDLQMELIQPKTMEFYVRQKRHNTWIEQKTERLGFGKGSILGICMRLACLKSILPNAGFLILDEPTANVDYRKRGKLREFLANIATGLNDEDKTQIILIEHDRDVIASCDQIIEIHG